VCISVRVRCVRGTTYLLPHHLTSHFLLTGEVWGLVPQGWLWAKLLPSLGVTVPMGRRRGRECLQGLLVRVPWALELESVFPCLQEAALQDTKEKASPSSYTNCPPSSTPLTGWFGKILGKQEELLHWGLGSLGAEVGSASACEWLEARCEPQLQPQTHRGLCQRTELEETPVGFRGQEGKLRLEEDILDSEFNPDPHSDSPTV
jgi:hypothetical protein